LGKWKPSHIFLLFGLYFLFGMASAKDNAPTLNIIAPNKALIFSQKELRSYPALTQITINNDRAYPNKTLHHHAIPLCKLLASFNVGESDIVELIAQDNFHVYVPSAKIMDCSKNASMAMLAIEPESKWQVINNHTGTTAGPFEVIWLHPERSYISNEYWAWSVVAIKISPKLDYKNVLAPPKTKNPSLTKGYNLYISHCEGCHTLNHEGKSLIGPDLNCPKNPWDYYPKISILKKFIREPKSVRTLPKGRMSGSDVESLSENDLNDLIKFFAYMNTKKQC
jgi:mono/diheme cytochrome c family protein